MIGNALVKDFGSYSLMLIMVSNHAAKCKLPFFAKPGVGYHRIQAKIKENTAGN